MTSVLSPVTTSIALAMGVSILQALSVSDTALAAPTWRATHFAACHSEELVMQANGSWWWYEQGRNVQDPVRYGGAYVTSSRQINGRDYGSRNQSSYEVTGLRLKRADGSWVDGFFIPLELADQICGTN